jgi:molybdate transport system substrate-binding protein
MRDSRWPAALVLLAALLAPGRIASAAVDPWSCVAPASGTPAASPTPSTDRGPVTFPDDSGQLTVFAAASLTDAFNQIADDINAVHQDIEITFNFAGSQALVTQIAEGGAEVDVLALASPAQMEGAVAQGIPATDPEVFATNQLVVVVPIDNPAAITAPPDLAKPEVRLVLAAPDVPAGAYARQALCNIAAATGMPVDGFAANVVSEEDNVRSVLTKVSLGEADAGIVYITDGKTEPDTVRTIEIPAELNVIARYPIATISDNPLAAAFVSYVLSAEGQAALASFGFGPVD